MNAQRKSLFLKYSSCSYEENGFERNTKSGVPMVEFADYEMPLNIRVSLQSILWLETVQVF
jgi:hypothetical protein